MKRVTAFVGCARKKYTYNAVRQFLDNLQSHGHIEYEIVTLSDYRLGTCRGCKTCFEKGEEFCPLKDDRDLLIEKMMMSDGVVFASPNYSFQVSALMKIFLDRLGFIFHRPCFFGKSFTSIIAQGIYGGQKIERYLNFVGTGLGFNTVKGTYFTALEPMTETGKQKLGKLLARQSEKFNKSLMKNNFPVPAPFKLMIFRMGRMSIKLELDECSRDFRYYKEKGWFESDYFYPVKLNAAQKLTGVFFDAIAAKMTKKRKDELALSFQSNHLGDRR
jgi:multimeric flavodoxin WrbA